MPSARGPLRGNAFLAGAVALPLLVVGIFVLATAIPRWTVPPPRHDVLLHTRAWDQAAPPLAVEFRVAGETLEAIVRPLPPNTSPQRSTLWLFDHAELTVREVPVALPERLAGDEPSRAIRIQALEGRRAIARAQAPDGYEVQAQSSRGPGLIGDLFGMRRYDRVVTLANRGRVVRIELPETARYAYPEFVAWLIDD